LDLLGVKPAIGWTFTDKEGEAAGYPVALIGEELWRRRFRANPNVAGEAIDLVSKSHTIIGVLPTAFQFGLPGTHIDAWIPRRR
jgi:putative ABC transport system permease protein